MVAVKKLSAQMDFSDTVFLDEVTNLMRLKHENIVRLLGYCADSQGEVMQVERLGYQIAEEPQRLLCFEYVPNGNVQHYLKEKSYGFEWVIRYQIIKGICQGVGYLHRERINHLDLKPENVLLGAHMVPKITDFGLSRCFAGSNSTMFTKNIIGTLGYIAPELIDRGQISSKSDIYSLGIIMIKLLLGSDEIDRDNVSRILNFYLSM
ncbi:hypothetical protein PR202_gb13274 [Eleusine coracana subsp. coracana]|uniref:non-specific serine/threonine protein kinase n=1 Tax=Eleusine coracana subsp. coracana TaxID=191504 RepID=A0AAV5ESU2_ELECO|nr:hypothetical protein PR202_gb13274 [Eleusine coracana subsp. coracana]